MRRKSLAVAGVLLAAVVGLNACTEPKVAAHIESTGRTRDTVAPGTVRTLTVAVTDQNSHSMEGVDVLWTVLTGAGTISSTKTTTGGDGTTSVTFTAPATVNDITSVAAGITHLGSASSFTVWVK